MPIRRILGEPVTSTPSTPVAESAAVQEPVIEETVAVPETEEHAEDEEVTSSGNPVHSKLINHLERYQVVGAVVEPIGNFLAPSVLYVKSLMPEAIVAGVKSVDGFFDDLLTRSDSVLLPESLKRVPAHEVIV